MDIFFHQPVKNDLTTHDNIRKITAGQRDDYTTGCLLDYPYLKANYQLTAIDLYKQQAFDVNPEAIQQINFAGDLDRQGNTTFFILEEEKETILDFSQGTVRIST